MRGFGTFYKKEITEIIRTYKALVLGIISFIMAIMNPLIAKLTPWLMEQLSDQMKEQGFAYDIEQLQGIDIEIDGQRLNASSAGDFLEKGRAVRVIGTESDHLLIKPVE